MNEHNNTLSDALLKETKASRRWKNIRFFGWILLSLLYAFLIFGPKNYKFDIKHVNKPYVSLVRLSGTIMPETDFSAVKVIPLLQKAFSDTDAKGVVIDINSPGGTPVQASIIHDKIEQLKQKYKKKVVIVGEDVMASGAYLIATSGDKIYVNKDTLTGSIGVIMSGFGFTDAMQKVGVTRRVYTAGDNKDRLDPFQPVNPVDIAKVNQVLAIAHQNFIDDVLQGRQGKLHGDPKELFSGDFWTGQQAVQLGLADGTGNLWDILQNEFGVQHYKQYKAAPNLWKILSGDAQSILHFSLASQLGNDYPMKAELQGY